MSDDTYEKSLEQDGRDLCEAAREGGLAPAYFRDEEIALVGKHLARGRSVLLVGPPGVGKSTVIRGVAHARAVAKAGGLYEISTAFLLAGTRYIGEWQTKVTAVARAAHAAGAILCITDIWNLPRAGRTSTSENNMLDALRPFLEAGELQLLGEVTPERLRDIERLPAFVRLFEVVEIKPLAEDQVDAALGRDGERRGLELDAATRASLITLTARFLAARPQPGPALALLASVADYADQKRRAGEVEPVTPAFVTKVFSIVTGLPPFVVSRSVTMSATQIRAWFSERIVGQRDAIEAVVETIALFKAGLHDPSKPIGTFLFVGPTGVGKTELARALATFIFGSPQRLLRFDLSEFKDYSSFELLLGDPQHPDTPARLLDPVRAHPFHVVLFDELEKAHPNVWDMLLPLLDEGRLSAPNGEAVSFQNTVIIATSNAGAQQAEKALGFGARVDPAAREGRTRQALEGVFRPELLNRFQHVVVFHGLSRAELRTVAHQEVGRVLTREGIASQRLCVDVDDDALDLVISEGLDLRFGARALKREVQRRIVLPLAMTLMEREVMPESIVKVSARDGELRIRVVETAESRAHRSALEPPRAPDGKILSREELAAAIDAAREGVRRIVLGLDAGALAAERVRLTALREDPEFWKEPALAERVHRDLDRISGTLERISALSRRANEADEALGRARTKTSVEEVGDEVRALLQAVADAERELLRMGFEGLADALVEVRPVGVAGREVRDLLVGAYRGWAAYRRITMEWLREPRADDEPTLFGLRGPYAFGLMRGEAGWHRLRLPREPRSEGEGRVAVAAVRVGPWTEAAAPPTFSREQPLKVVGQHAGKIRSCVECTLPGGVTALVLQNGRTLAQNRELAAEVMSAWAAMPAAPDEVVRRYEREPPLLRDARTGFTSGRGDAMGPRALDELLRLRVDT